MGMYVDGFKHMYKHVYMHVYTHVHMAFYKHRQLAGPRAGKRYTIIYCMYKCIIMQGREREREREREDLQLGRFLAW